MKRLLTGIFLLCVSASSYAMDESSCGTIKMMLKNADGDVREKTIKDLRAMGMGSMIDKCMKMDTSAVEKKMLEGPLYCMSAGGDLCGEYHFSHPQDRKLYLSSCNPRENCPSNPSDSCSLKGDKVRGGVGTVDWTLYAYKGLVRDKAANLKCK